MAAGVADNKWNTTQIAQLLERAAPYRAICVGMLDASVRVDPLGAPAPAGSRGVGLVALTGRGTDHT